MYKLKILIRQKDDKIIKLTRENVIFGTNVLKFLELMEKIIIRE